MTGSVNSSVSRTEVFVTFSIYVPTVVVAIIDPVDSSVS